MSGKGQYRYKDTRKLLDQLLGEDRNGVSDATARKHYSDPEFCRAFLCGLCPHEMFLNTKNDLGDCPKRHNESKRREYEAAVASGNEVGFDADLYWTLRRIVDECNKRVQRGQQRLFETQGPEDEDAISLQIKDMMKQVEALGEAGDVDGSMALLEQVQAIKEQKMRDEKARLQADMPDGMITVQRLRVCDACASFLSLYDNEKRLADHYSGKLHQSFVIIRRKIDQLEKDRHRWQRPNAGPAGPPLAAHAGAPPPPPYFHGGAPPPPRGPYNSGGYFAPPHDRRERPRSRSPPRR